MQTIHRKDLYEPELSFCIVGALYTVFNRLGYGHRESVYQKALAEELRSRRLRFTEQKYCPVTYESKPIHKYYLDFLIEEKIILEIKKGKQMLKTHIDQVLYYLRASGLRLGIIAVFTTQGVNVRRIINFNLNS